MKPVSLSGLSEDRHAKPRLIHEIARDIRLSWPKVHYAAEPYLGAMECLYTIDQMYFDQMYFQDSARNIILYFLSNAGTWRGVDAKRLKAELNAMLK